MDSQTRLGFELFAAALTLGVVGDQLLSVGPWGLNAALWLGGLVVASYGLAHRWGGDLIRAQRWVVLPLCALAVLFVGRDAATLKLVNAVAVLAALSLGIQRVHLARLRTHTSVALEPPGLLAAGAGALARLPRFLMRGIDWKALPADGRGQRMAAVGRGVLLAAPLLLVFGWLFTLADATFEALVARVFAFGGTPSQWPQHLMLTLLLTWLVGGFLYGILIKQKPAADAPEAPAEAPTPRAWFALGVVEVGVVLGLINALFATFMLVQLSYLFGGHTTVLDTADLTLAQYARRGFFELVMVASLALPCLLGLRRLLAVKAGRALRLFHSLAGVQVGLLLLILASAAQRMWLYQHVFGLTGLRLYVSAFLVWLAFVLGWFLLSVLRDRVEHFVPGVVAAGFAVLLGLHALNPDALIVRTNVARAVDPASLDTAYLASLSADAVPALLDALPALPPERQAEVAHRLIARWQRPPRADWRTWSRARAAAHRAVQAQAATLQTLAQHYTVPSHTVVPPSPRIPAADRSVQQSAMSNERSVRSFLLTADR